jgi:hypothetical protein
MHGNGNTPRPDQDPINQPPPFQAPDDLEPPEQEFQIDPRDVASAGRSCSAILVLMAAIVVVLIVGVILRWIFLS